jgi:hypothetical protein
VILCGPRVFAGTVFPSPVFAVLGRLGGYPSNSGVFRAIRRGQASGPPAGVRGWREGSSPVARQADRHGYRLAGSGAVICDAEAPAVYFE